MDGPDETLSERFLAILRENGELGLEETVVETRVTASGQLLVFDGDNRWRWIYATCTEDDLWGALTREH
jgi:hypothetical protein